MTGEADTPRTVPTAAPPKWMNTIMTAMLRTPGIQRLLGKTLALITCTGRKTGNRNTTPVTYYRVNDTVTLDR